MDKNILKKLADYAVREGTEHTTDGRWSVSYDELYSPMQMKTANCSKKNCGRERKSLS